MASINETNTLNDTKYQDTSVTGAKKRETPRPPEAGDEYDYVLAFFVKVMKDPSTASKFAASLYRVSQITQTNILQLLDTLKGQDEIGVNRVMAYYLNGLRSPATLIGVQTTVRPNYYAGRNVLS